MLPAKTAACLKIILSAVHRRRSRTAIILTAAFIGASVLFGLLSVTQDISAKMSREFRAYGANLAVFPRSGSNAFDPEAAEKVKALIPPGRLVGASPYLFGITRLGTKKLVLAGVDPTQLREVHPSWRLRGDWPSGGDVLIGSGAAERLKLNPGATIEVKSEDGRRDQVFRISGIVSTGGPEDYQIIAHLSEAQKLLDRSGQIDALYLSLLARGDELEDLAQGMKSELPDVRVTPIRQIARSEEAVLAKIKDLSWMAAVLILAATLVCVATATMTAVIERRSEIGLKKALGATAPAIALEFAGENALLGLIGGILGWGGGFLLAQAVGRAVFGSDIALRLSLLPVAPLVTLLVTVLASVPPVSLAVKIDPAPVLKGE